MQFGSTRVAANWLASCQSPFEGWGAETDHFHFGLSGKPKRRQVRPAWFTDHQQEVGEKSAGEISASENADKAFYELREYWTMLLGKLQVSTPDEHTNRMVNIWNAYQCMVTFNMSRSASYFESGIGRGMGFRDSNQDLLGFVHMIPNAPANGYLDILPHSLKTAAHSININR